MDSKFLVSSFPNDSALLSREREGGREIKKGKEKRQSFFLKLKALFRSARYLSTRWRPCK